MFKFSYLYRSFLVLLGLAGLCYALSFKGFTWLEGHFFVTLFLIVGTGIYGTKGSFEQQESVPSLKTVLGFSLLYFLPRLLKLPEQSLWLDESYQYHLVSKIPTGDFVKRVYEDAQPPIDYLFSFLSLKLQGLSAWSLKSVSLLWGWFSTIGLLIMGLSLGFKKHGVHLATAFWMAHPLVLGYQIEGRPYSLGIFSGIVLVYWNLKIFNKEKANSKDRILLFSVTLLHFYSVGFQPLFVWGTLFLIGLFHVKNNWKGFFLVNTLSFLMASPFFLYFYKSTQGGRIDFSHLEQNFSNERLAFFEREVFQLIESNWIWSLLFFALIIRGILILFNRSNGPKKKFALEFLAPFVFLGTILAVYFVSINWNFQVRYILCLFCFVPFMLFRVLAQNEWKTSFYHGLMAFLVSLSLSVIPRPLGDMTYVFKRPAWSELYALLNDRAKAGDHVMAFNLEDFSKERVMRPVALELYGNEVVLSLPVHNGPLPYTNMRPGLFNHKVDYCAPFAGHLFGLFQGNESTYNKLVGLSRVEGIFYKDGIGLLKLKGEGRALYQEFREFFSFAAKQVSSPKGYLMLEAMTLIDFIYGSKEEFLASFGGLKDVLRGLSVPPYYQDHVRRMESYFMKADSEKKSCVKVSL